MNRTIPSEIAESIQLLFTRLTQCKTVEADYTILHIGSDYTVLASAKGQPQTIDSWLLDLGSEKTAREFFSYCPPGAGEVEEAIQVVEDEVMTLSKLLPPNTKLVSFDSGIKEIAQQTTTHTDSSGALLLSRTQMEQVFGRLAAIISGRPVSSDTLPNNNSFATNLLILREVMFHLEFMEINSI